MKLEEVIIKCKEFYGNDLPKTVSEYIANYPKGLSRQVLKKRYNLTTGEFLQVLGSSYIPLEPTKDKFLKKCIVVGLTPRGVPRTMTKTTKVIVECQTCRDTFETYWDTLSQAEKGCRSCAGNKQLYLREGFLTEKAEKVNSKVVTLPKNNKDYMKLQCNVCDTIYSVQASKLTNPQTDKQATCPNCRDSDTRVVYEEITFGSQFERECYKLLKHLTPELQVLYKETFTTDRLWTCDFVIDDYWIEVSSYTKNSQGYGSYSSNIALKEDLVNSNGKHFIYLTSLREVNDFINKI